MFRQEDGLEVVGRCIRGDQVVETVRRCRPDILLLDMVMQGGDGLWVLRQLQHEPTAPRTILLSAYMDDEDVLEAIRLGARGVLTKAMAPRLIVQCIRKVHAGGEWLEQESSGRALKRMLRRESGASEVSRVLTPRELELVRLVASGLRNRDLASQLSITEGTVKIHLHHIYEKIPVDGRVALTIWAKDRGIV